MDSKLKNAEFKREERFIVVKRKHLKAGDEDALRKLLEVRNIATVECVVVESDWPEYETVWAMIEARCTGNIRAPDAKAETVAEIVADVADLFEALYNKPAAKIIREAGLCGTVHHAAADFLAAYAARHRLAAFDDGVVSTFEQRAHDLECCEKRNYEAGRLAGMEQAAVIAHRHGLPGRIIEKEIRAAKEGS